MSNDSRTKKIDVLSKARRGAFYRNVVLMGKTLTVSNIKNVFGFSDS